MGRSTDDGIDLLLLHCAPAGTAPSPFELRRVRHLSAVDVEAATVAMEELRAEAAEREADAEQRYEQHIEAAQRAAEDAQLRRIDEDAAAQICAGEERARREAAQQEAAEDRAQADALARSLRRP
jgi:hypothetical protein